MSGVYPWCFIGIFHAKIKIVIIYSSSLWTFSFFLSFFLFFLSSFFLLLLLSFFHSFFFLFLFFLLLLSSFFLSFFFLSFFLSFFFLLLSFFLSFFLLSFFLSFFSFFLSSFFLSFFLSSFFLLVDGVQCCLDSTDFHSINKHWQFLQTTLIFFSLKIVNHTGLEQHECVMTELPFGVNYPFFKCRWSMQLRVFLPKLNQKVSWALQEY